MNVGGISTNYSAAYEVGKTQKAGANNDFTGKIAEAEQENATGATAAAHGSDEESGDVAVFRVLYTNSGIKYTVYKTQDFSPENPIYKVKIWDEAENMTERMIDASKVNPRNSDTFEWEVYALYLKESGKGDFKDIVLQATMARGVINAEQNGFGSSWDHSAKINWVEAVKDIMQSSYNRGDFKGYMEWKKFLGFLE